MFVLEFIISVDLAFFQLERLQTQLWTLKNHTAFLCYQFQSQLCLVLFSLQCWHNVLTLDHLPGFPSDDDAVFKTKPCL